jgi:hypothetical protein
LEGTHEEVHLVANYSGGCDLEEIASQPPRYLSGRGRGENMHNKGWRDISLGLSSKGGEIGDGMHGKRALSSRAIVAAECRSKPWYVLEGVEEQNAVESR